MLRAVRVPPCTRHCAKAMAALAKKDEASRGKPSVLVLEPRYIPIVSVLEGHAYLIV